MILDHRKVKKSVQMIDNYTCTGDTIRIYTYTADTIRIFNGCEVQIENSVTRVTGWHDKASRVMPNSYPE